METKSPEGDIAEKQSSFDRVPQPLHRTAVDGHDVKAAGGRHLVTLQEGLRGNDQARLLACGDARCGAAETASGALSDLDKDKGLPILHHEVDFTPLAAEIAFDQLQAVHLKMAQRLLLTRVAFHLLGCASSCKRIKHAHQRACPTLTTLPS